MRTSDYQGYGVYSGLGLDLGVTQKAVPLPQVQASYSPIPITLTFAQPSSPTRAGALPVATAPISAGSPRLSAQPASLPALHIALRPVTARVRLTIKIPPQAPPNVKTAVLTFGGAAAGLGAPSLGFVQQGGLWLVDPASLPLVEVLLDTMSLTGGAPTTATQEASAFLVLGQMKGNALDTIKAAVAAGWAALVDKSSIAAGTGMVKIVFSADPSVIAQKASGPNATHALLYPEPAALLGDASSLAAPAGGQVLVPGPNGTLVPGPGADGGGSSGAPLPSWVVPVIVGVGVLAVGAVFYAAKKR